MTYAIITAFFAIYLLTGALILLSSDLEMRTVCRRTWQSKWLYLLALLVWPIFYGWMRVKWLRKKHEA